MNDLKFCPKCGEKSLLWSEGKKWSCKQCDFVLFHNCAAAVAVMITCGDEIMFTKRNQEPAKGKLDLAGGFTDPNESAENTCVRELKEELNIEINPKNLKFLKSIPNLYPYKGIIYNTLDMFFEYKVDNKFSVDLALDEISEIVWINKQEISLNDIAFASQKEFFKDYLNQK